MGRRIVVLGTILGLLVFGASGAGAADTFTDPQGDATAGAADVTQIAVSNDDAGTITFSFTFANRSALTSDDFLAVPLDTDRNATTGFNGFDFGIFIDATGANLLQGSSTGFTRVTAATLTSANGGLTVTVNRSDLGNTTGFLFGLDSGLNSNSSAEDLAPNTGAYTYELGVKHTLGTLAARFSPAKPKAGKTFRLAGTTLRLDDGSVVKGSVTCVAKLNGKRLAGRCSWRIPKNARGKQLVVTLTGRYQGEAATFTPWRFRVG